MAYSTRLPHQPATLPTAGAPRPTRRPHLRHSCDAVDEWRGARRLARAPRESRRPLRRRWSS